MRIKKKIDGALSTLFEKMGRLFIPLILYFKHENNKLLIFYFHGLYESNEQNILNHIDPQNNITVSQFSDFIDYFIKHKYIFIKPEDLLRRLEKDQRYAMITFDDGYFNNLLALDILNKKKVPAVFFVTTKNIVENRSFWWDIIYRQRIKEGHKLSAIREEQANLKKLNYTDIDNYIESNFGSASFIPWSDIDRPFTEAELKDFASNSFVSIGNHTHNHAILDNYDRKTIHEEFELSNKILTGITGKVPCATAFPNGNYNEMVLDVAQNMGFRFAFSTEPKVNNLPLEIKKFHCLSRIMTTTDNIKKQGGFYRLGYKPTTLYSGFKNKAIRFFKGAN